MCPGKERTLEKWDLKIDEAFYTTVVERGMLKRILSVEKEIGKY